VKREGGRKLTSPDDQAQPSSPLEAASRAERLRGRRFVALALLGVATLFSGVVIGVMVTSLLAERANTPRDPETGERRPPETPALRLLKEQIGRSQGQATEALRKAIREEDQRLRARFFTYRRRMYWGAWLLLVGLVGVVASARWYASLDPKMPMPKPLAERPDADVWLRARRRSLVAVAVVAGILGASLLVMGLMGLMGHSKLPPHDEPSVTQTTTPVAVDRAGFQDDWPRFRGPTGMGIVAEGDWPTDWDAKSGRNILWKSELATLKGGEDGKQVVPYGRGSPVVWGNRIFLTGGDERKLEVFCYERKSGKLLWRTPVESPLLLAMKSKPKTDDEDEFKVFEDTGYAAATPATDGRHVYVVFATADVAALDFGGKIVWQRHLGTPDNMYGMASSLVVHKNLLLLQHDQGGEEEDKLSALIAMDTSTGKTVWRAPRPVPNSWTTPIVVGTGSRTEVVTSANSWVIAFQTGRHPDRRGRRRDEDPHRLGSRRGNVRRLEPRL
jgi:hypothetical protein